MLIEVTEADFALADINKPSTYCLCATAIRRYLPNKIIKSVGFTSLIIDNEGYIMKGAEYYIKKWCEQENIELPFTF